MWLANVGKKGLPMTDDIKLPGGILLVDDETDLLDLFEMVLVRLGSTLYKANSGRRALEILENVRPDIIVLDLAMPEISGLDVLRAVRRRPELNTVKIVILTAVPVLLQKEDVEAVEIVLTKPVTPRGLEQAIRKLIGS
jgi:CheY-like chemotaxis protein